MRCSQTAREANRAPRENFSHPPGFYRVNFNYARYRYLLECVTRKISFSAGALTILDARGNGFRMCFIKLSDNVLKVIVYITVKLYFSFQIFDNYVILYKTINN